MMRRLVLVALAFAPAALCATTYTFEPNYTQGVFRWDHLGFSHPSAQFSQVQGRLEFDPQHPAMSSVSVTIPLSSLHTGVPDLDDDFRSAAFFDTSRFPTATFKSTRVEALGNQHLKVTGDLTMHGVTHAVTLDAQLIKIGVNPRSSMPTIGFEATAKLKRSDFGLGHFIPQVGDEIEVQINSQAVAAKPDAENVQQKAATQPASGHQ
jgi:polyisoprenoid-binding protein YceI